MPDQVIQNNKPQYNLKHWAITTAVCIILYGGIIFSEFGFSSVSIFGVNGPFGILMGIGMGAIAGTMYYSMYYGFKRIVYSISSKQIASVMSSNEAITLQDNLEENFFTNLVKINFKYLDKYYLQTQVQAEKSFILSALAAVFGFLVIVVGILLMIFDKVNSSYVATGAGLISEFIAAIFFYLYNRTILKMSEYHQKLVLTQNLSLALKISEALPKKERTETQVKLISELTLDINKLITGINIESDQKIGQIRNNRSQTS